MSVLVEYGADVQRRDEHGKTVSDYAADNRNGVSRFSGAFPSSADRAVNPP